nr:uncharacterized protein LOC108054111 [Drosophila takahashii]
MIEKLNSVKFVCTTADIWSTKKRSFFGYTCHWLDNNFQRHSVALACSRMAGSHTFHRVAEFVQRINDDFHLSNEQIVCTITDNGSNFVKAFKEFGISLDNEGQSEGVADYDDDVPESQEIPLFRLPKHYRCGCHTLNLLATTDYMSIIKSDSRVFGEHASVLKRCSAIWNKCNRPKTAECIKSLLGCSLKTPVATRWNTLYDAFKHVLKFKDQFDDLFKLLDVTKFTSSEMEYLQEYCKIMEPLATGLDFLQNEKTMLYGYFVPTILTLKVKWEKMNLNNEFNFLNVRIVDLINALEGRFRDIFTVSPKVHDAFVAAITCPAIKFKFLPSMKSTAQEWTDLKFKDMFLKHASAFFNDTPSTSVRSKGLSFFDFGETTEDLTLHESSVVVEFGRYLNDMDEDLECLNRYPIIKATFFKYNTPLPSSAPVERLFSYAGMVNGKKRQNLSDGHFEKLVVLKANNVF